MELPLTTEENLKLIASRLVCEYIQLLLFQRCQIPEPVQLIKRKLQKKPIKDDSQVDKKMHIKRKKEASETKKCEEFIQNLDKINEHVKKAVDFGLEEAVILFGSTPISTKEMFSIQIVKSGDYFAFPCDTIKSQTLNTICRKFCLNLFQSGFDLGSKSELMKTHVFVKCRKSAAGLGLRPWPDFDYPEKKLVKQIDLVFRNPVPRPSGLDDSIVTFTENLNLDCDKENSVLYYKRGKEAFNESTVLTPEKHPPSSDHDNYEKSPQKPNPSRQRLNLSAEEILDAVLSANDCDSDNSNYDDIESTTPDDKIWFQLPISIKGFRYA